MDPAAAVPRKGPLESQINRIMRRSWVFLPLGVLLVGCAIAVICVVRWELEGIVYVSVGELGTVWRYTCLLSVNAAAWACQYAYALGAFSLVLSFAVFVTQCITFEAATSRAARVTEGVLEACSFAWWLAGAIVLTVEYHKVQATRWADAQAPARQGVIAVCWVAAGLSLLMFLANVLMAAKITKALRADEGKQVHHDVEDARPLPVAAPAVA